MNKGFLFLPKLLEGSVSIYEMATVSVFLNSKEPAMNDWIAFFSDVNPLLKLGDLEQAEDVVQDSGNNYLMCVSESFDKQSKELTVGMVVSHCCNTTECFSWLKQSHIIITFNAHYYSRVFLLEYRWSSQALGTWWWTVSKIMYPIQSWNPGYWKYNL